MYSKLRDYFYDDIDKLYDIKPVAEQNMNMTAYFMGPIMVMEEKVFL